MEEGDDGAFELSTTTSVNGSGGEGLPNNVLANVGGDEEGNTRAQTVALLQQLVLEEYSQYERRETTVQDKKER